MVARPRWGFCTINSVATVEYSIVVYVFPEILSNLNSITVNKQHRTYNQKRDSSVSGPETEGLVDL